MRPNNTKKIPKVQIACKLLLELNRGCALFWWRKWKNCTSARENFNYATFLLRKTGHVLNNLHLFYSKTWLKAKQFLAHFQKGVKNNKKKQGKNVTPKPRCKRVKWYAFIFHFAATTYAKICQKMCSAQLPTKLCLAYPPCLPATASFYSHNFDLHLKNILARLHPCTPQEGHNSQPHTDGRSHV